MQLYVYALKYSRRIWRADKIVLGKNSYLVKVNDQEYATQ